MHREDYISHHGRHANGVHKGLGKFYGGIGLVYYNQNAYGSIPYPAPNYTNATVKTSGCGVCCVSMIAETLTPIQFPPALAAKFAIANGARVSGGTDMLLLAPNVAVKFGLGYSVSNNILTLKSVLSRGGMAIVNVGGNRSGWYGVFSNAGHYVVAAGIQGDKIAVLDPGYYNGKFDLETRKGKVKVEGNVCWVAADVLDKDANNRDPRYYIFEEV